MPREQSGMVVARSRSEVADSGGERGRAHDDGTHGVRARHCEPCSTAVAVLGLSPALSPALSPVASTSAPEGLVSLPHCLPEGLVSPKGLLPM